MFTGIVEETGKVISKEEISEGFKFRVQSKEVIKKLKISDSVCVNGACHTITGKSKDSFEFVTMHETLKKTNLAELTEGSVVNLENSLLAGQPLGGHFVAGHVDTTGIVKSVKVVDPDEPKSKNWGYWIKFPKKHAKHA